MPGRVHLAIVVIACLLGLMFAGVSTFDFAQHLDREVHDLHCSFIPGAKTDLAQGASSGCQVTMMSPYSSVLRTSFWGGIPISLPAMATFAFLAYRALDVLGRHGVGRRRSAGVLFAFSAVPVIASLVMGVIALVELEAACRLCLGIYGASLVTLLAAGLAYASIRRAPLDTDDAHAPSAGMMTVAAFAQLGAFVGIAVVGYVAKMPDYSRFVGTCGKLDDTSDPGKIMVDLDKNAASHQAIEVFDPLCPACRAFDRRLVGSGLDREVHRRAVLFPLDNSCNWMVDQALHPGACTISEAILCADEGKGPPATAVVEWAFEAQEKVREASKNDPDAARRMVVDRFPDLGGCVGSDAVRQRLNKSLRWAVAHAIPVLTPQLFVNGTKLCPEDTDLGLEYSLTGLLRRGGGR